MIELKKREAENPLSEKSLREPINKTLDKAQRKIQQRKEKKEEKAERKKLKRKLKGNIIDATSVFGHKNRQKKLQKKLQKKKNRKHEKSLPAKMAMSANKLKVDTVNRTLEISDEQDIFQRAGQKISSIKEKRESKKIKKLQKKKRKLLFKGSIFANMLFKNKKQNQTLVKLKENFKKQKRKFYDAQDHSVTQTMEENNKNLLNKAVRLLEKAIKIKIAQVVIFAMIFLVLMMPLMSIPFLGVLVGAMAGGENASNMFFGNRPAIETNMDVYADCYQNGNPYTLANLRGQCTWFVWGRVKEVFGIDLPTGMGNAGDWLNYAKRDSRFIISDEPRAGAIIVTKGDAFGHVAFIESYDPITQTATVSEGNVGNPMSGSKDMVPYAHEHFDKLLYTSKWKKSDKRWNAPVLGYLYLDNFNQGGPRIKNP